MITIKTNKSDKTQLKISEGTKYSEIIVGIEMLIEAVLANKYLNITLDDLLEDIKHIYERDNKKEEEK